jgi:pimeloyl-ACP methyl ester carboxylesterase
MKTIALTDTPVALDRRRFALGLPLLAIGAASPELARAADTPAGNNAPIVTHHRTKMIDGIKIFYREAGPANAPVVLLLHGFPTSSHMFRNLIPELADRYHVIALDYPGYGQSDMPDRATFSYTFDRFGELVDGLLDQLDVKRYAMYVMDYGAPVGWRLALKHPERITALIVQNGNAYDEGLKEFWDPIKTYWSDHSE